MHWITRLLIEPLYRMMFGPPIEDRLPATSDNEVKIEAGTPSPVPGRNEGSPSEPTHCDGLVISVGGVGGLDLCGTGLRFALARERLCYLFYTFHWSHGFGRWHADLTRVSNRDQKARELAALVRRFRAERPGTPVFLVAKSGGCGVVVKALEQLAENSVERAILLAPALSPDYDLSTALAAVHLELVIFWSPLDLVILGAGTRLFGTADRVRTSSAGLVSFHVPAGSKPYGRLRQVRWLPRMVATGNLGGHIGADSPIFLRKYVLPLLRPEPSEVPG